MADERVGLEFILTAKDDTGRDIVSAERGIDRLGDEARDTGRDFDRMGRRARISFDQIKAGARSAFNVIRTGLRVALAAGIAGGIAAGGLAAKLIGEASEAEEISSKFDAVFKDLSESTREWVNDQAKSLQRSRFDLEQYMASLQDTFVPMGFARAEAAELSKQLTLLGVDLASFNNAAEDETLQLLTSALVGNHEAVRRFGIILTESTLKQEMARRATQGLTLDSIEQEKVMARFALIMRNTTDAQGDAVRTSEGFANRLRGLKATARDAAVEMGAKLLPVAGEMVDKFRDWINQLSETGVLAAWGDAVASAARKAFNFVVAFVESGKLVEVGETIKTVLSDAWDFVKDRAADAARLMGFDLDRFAEDFKNTIVDMADGVTDAFAVMASDIDILLVKFERLAFVMQDILERSTGGGFGPFNEPIFDRETGGRLDEFRRREEAAEQARNEARQRLEEARNQRGIGEDADTIRRARGMTQPISGTLRLEGSEAHIVAVADRSGHRMAFT